MRSITIFALLSIAFTLQAAEPQFEELFTLEGSFNMPESAVIDENGEFVYVSNVNVYAKDGNGFISRVRTDGTDLQLRWLEGLDSPTGLAITGNRLFLADYDQLVEVDLTSANIVARYASPDADPVLNDVAIANDGMVYVSGSGSRTIYRLAADALEVWLEDRDRLAFANGLLAIDERLIHGGQTWTVFDAQTTESTDMLSVVNNTISDIDGITTDHCDGYFVTSIPSDEVWWIQSDGTVGTAPLGAINGIDLHRRDNLLAIPRVGDSLSVYRTQQSCD